MTKLDAIFQETAINKGSGSFESTKKTETCREDIRPNITLFYIISAYNPTSVQTSNLVVIRLQTIYCICFIMDMLWLVICIAQII